MNKETILKENREQRFKFSDYELLDLLDTALDFMLDDSKEPLERVGYSIGMIATVVTQLERRHEND